MSRMYDLYVNLKSSRPVPETHRRAWKKILSAAVADPESVIEKGVDRDFGDDGDEIDVLDLNGNKTEFSFRTDKQIGGGYGLDAYLADVEKAVYLAMKPLKKRYEFSYSATDLDREPDVSNIVTSGELAAKYGLIA